MPEEFIYTPVGTLGAIVVNSSAGAATGETAVTAAPTLPAGHTAYYQTGASITLPSLDDIITGLPWSSFTNNQDYPAAAGDDFAVIYVDGAGKCKYAGKTTAVVA